MKLRKLLNYAEPLGHFIAFVPRVRQPTLIHKDGCDFCTACGYVGQCG